MPLFSPKRQAVDWRAVHDLKMDRLLQEDEGEVERLEGIYDNLIQCAPAGNTLKKDLIRLYHLTQLASLLLELKGEDNKQLEKALDKAEDELREANQLLSRGEAGLQGDIRKLERRLELSQQEADEHQQALDDAQDEIARLNDDLRDKDKELEERDKTIDELKSRNRTHEEAVADYKHQIAMSHENIDVQKREAMREVVRNKTQELTTVVDRLQEASEANRRLEEQVQQLTASLQESVANMEQASDRIAELQAGLRQADADADEARRERDVLQSRVEDLEAQLHEQSTSDDRLMHSVNKTVEQWRSKLAEKESELSAANKLVDALQKELAISGGERLARMQGTIEQQAREIEVLKGNLEQATHDMSSMAADVEHAKNLTSTLHDEGPVTIPKLEYRLKQAQRELRSTQADLEAKDKELVEVLARMTAYEQGVYGLHEAVKEIKEHKAQVKIRDRDIAELTRETNDLNRQVSELADENEELRSRLGLDLNESVDLANLRRRRNVEAEQLRAVNRLLSRDVERLEAERLDLKQRLMKQALTRGERAVELGLTSTDLANVEYNAEGIPKNSVALYAAENSVPIGLYRNVRAELEDAHAKIERLERNLAEARDREQEAARGGSDAERARTSLRHEKESFGQALHELRAEIAKLRAAPRDQHDTEVNVTCPALDHAIALLEQSGAGAEARPSLSHAQFEDLNKLKGAHSELRKEHTELKGDLEKAHRELEREALTIERLQREVEELKAALSATESLHPMKLPGNMQATSTDIIGNLSEHLVEVLHELETKEAAVAQLETALGELKRETSVAVHQQGLLYNTHLATREGLDATIKRQKDKIESLSGELETAQVYKAKFEELQQGMAADPDEKQSLLAEVMRKNTILKVNEKALIRRYSLKCSAEDNLRKENMRLRKDFTAMEAAVTERIAYLERHKEASNFRMASFQQALMESVSKQELEEANRKCQLLGAKYRALLERENADIEDGISTESLRHENQKLRDENAVLEKRAAFLDSKAEKLQAQVAELQHSPDPQGEGSAAVLRNKSQALEMQVLNERQRAELLAAQRAQADDAVAALEKRNLELEAKFKDMSELYLKAQETEKELRDELAGCVTISEHQANSEKIHKLQGEIKSVRLDNDRLKSLADVAAKQMDSIRFINVSQEKEVMSLRKQLEDMQTMSDDKATIGKLHHHIIALQLSEGTAVRKLESSEYKVLQLQASNLQLEKLLDERDESLRQYRIDSTASTRFLRRTIQSLRQQYSGALTLQQQEAYTKSLKTLRERKVELETDLQEAKRQRFDVEDQLAALQVQHDGVKELLNTLHDGKGAQKVAGWHRRMVQTRLSELQLKRELARAHDQARHLEETIARNETNLHELEVELVMRTKEFEEREMSWEEREHDLESALQIIEKQQKRSDHEVQRMLALADGEVLGPDPSLPVPHQLEAALHSLQMLSGAMARAKDERDAAQRKAEEMATEMKELRAKILGLEAEQADLRLQMGGAGLVAGADETPAQYEARKTREVAQQTVASLRDLLQRKEEALARSRAMLEAAHQEALREREEHAEELHRLTERLTREAADTLRKTGSKAKEVLGEAQAPGSADLLARQVAEYEDMVAEQDQQIRMLSEKLQEARRSERHDRGAQQALQVANGEIDMLRRQLEESRKIENQPPSPQRTQRQLQARDAEIASLREALDEMVRQQAEARQPSPSELAEKSALEAKLQEVSERLADYQKKMRRAQAVVKRQKEKQAALEETCQKLQAKEAADQDEIERLKHALVRAEEAGPQRLPSKKPQDGDRTKALLAKSEARVAELEKELASRDQMAQQKEARPSRISAPESEQFKRWDQDKKLQRRLEQLRDKLNTKTSEHEAMRQQVEQHRTTIARLDRERGLLKAKLRAREAHDAAGGRGQDVPSLMAKVDTLQQELAVTKANLRDAEHQAKVENAGTIRELEQKNHELQETIDVLEERLDKLESGAGLKAPADEDEVQDLVEKEQRLARELLDSEKENIELRFQLEAAREDARRLEAELAETAAPAASDRSVEELERVVEAMGRATKKLQAENARLKEEAAKGPSNQRFMDLLKENKQLKRQLEEADARRDDKADPRTVAKLSSEHDRLRGLLRKEREVSGKLRKQVAAMEAEMVELRQQGSSENAAAAAIEELKAEVELKTRLLGEAKVHLRNAAEFEAESIQRQEELERRLKAMGQAEPARMELQAAREREERATRERDALLGEVERLQRALADGGRGGAADSELLQQLQAENAQLRGELESFDPKFFEEIEDLKFAYAECLARLERYEGRA